MRVIVTGANGFIGKYVAKLLANVGHDVIAVDRKVPCVDRTGFAAYEVDLLSVESIRNFENSIQSADVMVHLAADITVPGDESTIANNIGIMKNVLMLSQNVSVKHFILLSSIPVIGRPEANVVDENHPVRPSTSYHWSKYLSEKMLDCYNDRFTSAVMRIPSPIGVGMRPSVFMSVLLDKMRNNDEVEIYGQGNRVQNYIDVRDIAMAIMKGVETKQEGLFLLAGRKSLSNIELANLCREICSSTSEIITGRHDDPEENIKWIISGEKAKTLLGFKPQYSIEDTLKWICSSVN